MKIFTPLLTVLLSLFWIEGTAQQAQETIIEFDSIQVDPGASFELDIKVYGFDLITSAQFGMLWDPSVVQIDSIRFIGSAGENLFNYNLQEGNLRVLFESSSVNTDGISYSDGTVIAIATCVAVGRAGHRSTLSANPALQIEVIESASIERQARIREGWVHLRGVSGIATEVKPQLQAYWPDASSMNITSSMPAGTTLCVYGTDGRRVGCTRLEQTGFSRIEFDTEQAPGIYFLRLDGEPQSQTIPIQGPGWH